MDMKIENADIIINTDGQVIEISKGKISGYSFFKTKETLLPIEVKENISSILDQTYQGLYKLINSSNRAVNANITDASINKPFPTELKID